MSLVRKPDGRCHVRVWHDGRLVCCLLACTARCALLARRASARVTLGMVLLGLCGCGIPVANYVGRPAAVIPSGHVAGSIVLGGVNATEQPGSGTESKTLRRATVALEAIFGLRERTDLLLGLFALPVNQPVGPVSALCVFRWQTTGCADGYRSVWQEGRCSVDASVEAGFGYNTDNSESPGTTFSDGHVGVNVSFPYRGAAPWKDVTPYVSYRHHWGWYELQEEGSGVLSQHMIFLGIDLPFDLERRCCVEVFAGWPSSERHDESRWQVWGVNLAFRGRALRDHGRQ